MKNILILFILFCSPIVLSQGYEIILYDASINEFDVFGDDSYETNNRSEADIIPKVQPGVTVTSKAEPDGADKFEAKNLIDGNMHSCWLSAGDGKNDQIEIIIDLEEFPWSGGQIKFIYFYNGWRKDLHTWKDYSRVKKMTLSINDMPYAEINFEDTYKQQSIDIDKLKIEKNRRCKLKFRVVDVFPGKKVNQVAISDIQIIGKVK